MTKNGIKYYRVTNKLIDIFQGEGWSHHSRYKLVGSSLEHLRGLIVSKQVQETALSVLKEK